jgi:hypothetical protein
MTNAGGAVAMLSFIGAAESVRNAPWSKIVLGLFLLGLILVGIVKAHSYHHVADIYNHWKKASGDYFGDKIVWEYLTQKDDEVSAPKKLPYVLAYGAFACFIGGVTYGMFSFF